MKRIVRIAVVLAAVAALALAGASTAQATKPAPDHRVTICHRTDSEMNPYVRITVDQASVDGDTGNDHGKGDHLAEHTGPVWYPGIPKEPKWGDIIPPFYSDGKPDGLPSLNWTDAGQAIFDNGCKPVESTPAPTVEPTPTVAPTESPEVTPSPPSETSSPSVAPSVTPSVEPTVPPCDECGGPGDTPTPPATFSPKFTPPNTSTGVGGSGSSSGPSGGSLIIPILLGLIAASLFILAPRPRRAR